MKHHYFMFLIIGMLGLLVLGCSEDQATNPAASENFQFDENTIQTVITPKGCTLTPGYWKTHPEEWMSFVNTTFTLSGQTFFEVLWTEPAGNAYYILAHQAIAAYLNYQQGASVPTEVGEALTDAASLFNTHTPAQIAPLKGNDMTRKQFIKLAELLDDYNNGLIGPGHCED